MTAPASPWGLGPSTVVAAGVLALVMAVLSVGWTARRPSSPMLAVTWLQPPPQPPGQVQVPPAPPSPQMPERVEAPAPKSAPPPPNRPRQETRNPAPGPKAAKAVDSVAPRLSSTAAGDRADAPVERGETAAPASALPSTPAPASVTADVHVVCPVQVRPRFPELADEDVPAGAVVRARASIQDGRVQSVEILSGPRILHRAVREAMLQYRCRSEPGETVEVLQDFRLAY